MQLLNQPFGQIVGKRQNAALPLSISNEGCARPSATQPEPKSRHHDPGQGCAVLAGTPKSRYPKPKEQVGKRVLESNQRTRGAGYGTTPTKIARPSNAGQRCIAAIPLNTAILMGASLAITNKSNISSFKNSTLRVPC